MAKPGRKPLTPTKEVVDEIIRLVSTNTLGLRALCEANPHIPSHDIIQGWRYDFPDFAARFTQAKMRQAELLAEEAIEISDDASRDIKLDKDGNEICDHEYIQRSRLRVDTRKWIACKLAPKLYGDKQTIEQHVINHEQALKDME